MAILSTIIVGLIVGAIAKLLMPGKDPGGFIVTILLGIAGAFIASYLGQAIGWYKPGQPAGWIMSVIGAMILLLLYRLLFKRKSQHFAIESKAEKQSTAALQNVAVVQSAFRAFRFGVLRCCAAFGALSGQ
jgi:uncharacterized membrane protein YeaQ/YmgE (transglycosylase-associated protein family)